MAFFGRSGDVYITGDKQLDKKLRTLGTTLARKYLRKATREVAKHVLADARSMVRVKTGKLKRSLKVRALPRRGRKQDEIGHTITTGSGLFEGETFYGGFLEFGWAPMRGRRNTFTEQKAARRRARYQRAKLRGRRGNLESDVIPDLDRNEGYPFLRPALYGKDPERLQMFVATVRQFIHDEGK